MHDLHIWTLTSEMEVASAHLMVRRAATATPCWTRPAYSCGSGYGIDHATLQVEPDTHEGCDDVSW